MSWYNKLLSILLVVVIASGFAFYHGMKYAEEDLKSDIRNFGGVQLNDVVYKCTRKVE